MKILCKRDFEELDKAGLIKHNGSEKNFTVINRGKKSKRKKYAVVYDWRDKELHDAIKCLSLGKQIPERCVRT